MVVTKCQACGAELITAPNVCCRCFDELKKDRDKLFAACTVWWQQSRPAGWSEGQHLRSPAINQQSLPDAVLAINVATMLRLERMNRARAEVREFADTITDAVKAKPQGAAETGSNERQAPSAGKGEK